MSLIPDFDFQKVFVAPWTTDFASFGWIVLMGFLVTLACGLVGNFLILRKIAMVGDATSHSILPGIAIAFLVSQSTHPLIMFTGALVAGIVASVLIELVHRRSRVKEDAAMGVVFSTLFAIGVVIISLYAAQVDLDADCVLYGELVSVGAEPRAVIAGVEIAPMSVCVMGGVCIGVIVLLCLFYKELLVTSFDPALAITLGLRPGMIHYGLMCVLSLVIVSAFRSVGAILVVAMLILPGATAFLLVQRLPAMLWLTVLHSVICAVAGMHLAVWLNCSVGAAMVVTGAGLFVLAWMFNSRGGLLRRQTMKVQGGPLNYPTTQ